MQTLEEIFKHSYIDTSTPLVNNVHCRIWTGGVKDKNRGYGSMSFNGRSERTHRVVLHLSKGFDLNCCSDVLHKCNNDRCIEPEHIKSGSPSENMYDMVEAGNHVQARKTHCVNGHEYTKENTGMYEYRRYCKECKQVKNSNVPSNYWKERKRIQRAKQRALLSRQS